MLNSADLRELQKYLRKNHASLKQHHDDILQAAYERAHVACANGNEAEFRVHYQHELRGVIAEYQLARKRGGLVAEYDDEKPDVDSLRGALMPHARAVKRAVRSPAGAVPVVSTGRRDYVLIDEASAPSIRARLAAIGVVHSAKRVLDSEVASDLVERALAKAHEAIHDEKPESLFALVLAEEIGKMKLQCLGESAPQGRKNKPLRAGTFITLKRKPSWPWPRGAPQEFEVAVRVVPVSELLAVFIAEIDGQAVIVGRGEGRWELAVDTPPHEAVGARAGAQIVLLNAIGRLAGDRAPCIIPAYALDADLILMLVRRMGFQAGGGRRGQISAKGVARLLSDPNELARDIAKYGQRAAERGPASSRGLSLSYFDAMRERVLTAMKPARIEAQSTDGRHCCVWTTSITVRPSLAAEMLTVVSAPNSGAGT